MKLEVGKYYKTRDGRKVGPMAIEESQDSTSFHWNVQGAGVGRWDESGDDGYASTFTVADGDLIAPWTAAPTGPVRTVTRKEIVPGVYGGLEVGQAVNGLVFLAMPIANFGQESIDALIANLTVIRDALEDGQ